MTSHNDRPDGLCAPTLRRGPFSMARMAALVNATACPLHLWRIHSGRCNGSFSVSPPSNSSGFVHVVSSYRKDFFRRRLENQKKVPDTTRVGNLTPNLLYAGTPTHHEFQRGPYPMWGSEEWTIHRRIRRHVFFGTALTDSCYHGWRHTGSTSSGVLPTATRTGGGTTTNPGITVILFDPALQNGRHLTGRKLWQRHLSKHQRRRYWSKNNASAATHRSGSDLNPWNQRTVFAVDANEILVYAGSTWTRAIVCGRPTLY